MLNGIFVCVDKVVKCVCLYVCMSVCVDGKSETPSFNSVQPLFMNGAIIMQGVLYQRGYGHCASISYYDNKS